MRRRDVLYGIGASAIALGHRALAADKGPGSDLSATVLINGKRFDYQASAGQDQGDFHGQNFVQRCIRVERSDTPLTVYFRPDRTSNRVEVVFELGRAWGAVNRAAAHLGAYQATIRRGAETLATLDVPNHWWFSRWRWQSAPRPVIATPQQLIAAKLLPPYSAEVAKNAIEIDAAAIEYRGPMDNAGVTMYIGTTGERPDIGPVTEYQALYLTTGDSAALNAVLAQAEAAGSMPMHVRDERTGAPVDVFQYPRVNWYYIPSGDQWIRDSGSIVNSTGQPTCPWQLNSSHDPALNYLPYLLTGDPYFLEELQFQANQLLGATNTFRSKLQVVYAGETRSYAWSMRTVFQVTKVTPVSTPRWLKPRAYWKHVLDDNRTYFTQTFVNSKARASSVFHAATDLRSIAGWEEDFLAFSLGWGVLLGFAEWRPAYLWKLQATLARTNGKSGWPRQWCSPYYYTIAPNLQDCHDPACIPPGAWFKSWADAWNTFKSNPDNKVPPSFTDDTSWQEPLSGDFLIYTRGVLAVAKALGVAEAVEPYEYVNNMVQQKEYMTRRWAVASSL